MRAREYNQLLQAIKDTNNMLKTEGKPLQEKLRVSIIADYGINDPDVQSLLRKMHWV